MKKNEKIDTSTLDESKLNGKDSSSGRSSEENTTKTPFNTPTAKPGVTYQDPKKLDLDAMVIPKNFNEQFSSNRPKLNPKNPLPIGKGKHFKNT